MSALVADRFNTLAAAVGHGFVQLGLTAFECRHFDGADAEALARLILYASDRGWTLAAVVLDESYMEQMGLFKTLGLLFEWDWRCRVCGCTEEDCEGCMERSGGPCCWVHTGTSIAPLCSSCYDGHGPKLEEVPL